MIHSTGEWAAILHWSVLSLLISPSLLKVERHVWVAIAVSAFAGDALVPSQVAPQEEDDGALDDGANLAQRQGLRQEYRALIDDLQDAHFSFPPATRLPSLWRNFRISSRIFILKFLILVLASGPM